MNYYNRRMSSPPYQKVINYFQLLESKLGYDLILGGVKHFGYYPSGKMDIPEKKAQILTQDLLAKKIYLSKNDHVLDAGCGQGYVATYLAQKYGCRVTGITITPFEVRKASNLAKKRRIEDKVKFLEMDYAKTNFPNNYFDAIFTMESFVHAYDLEKTLKEFKRILKPGGRIVFFEYSLAPDEKINQFVQTKKLNNFKKILDWTIEKGAMFSLKKMRHGELPKILKKIGFKNIKEENITSHMRPSMERLYSLAKILYFFVKLFYLQDYFINTTVAADFFPYLLKYQRVGLLRYNITLAKKD